MLWTTPASSSSLTYSDGLGAIQPQEAFPCRSVHTIGIDIAKNVFQVHGVDADEEVVLTRQLRRKQVLPFFDKLASCLIGMEECATAHH